MLDHGAEKLAPFSGCVKAIAFQQLFRQRTGCGKAAEFVAGGKTHIKVGRIMGAIRGTALKSGIRNHLLL